MKTYINPNQEQWSALSKRKTFAVADLNETVKGIFSDVQKNGDAAVSKYTSIFDGVSISDFEVTEKEIQEATGSISEELKNAILQAANNIEKFHASQKEIPTKIETTSGVFERRNREVGL